MVSVDNASVKSTANVPASGAEFTVAVTAVLLPVVHEPSVAST